MLPGQHLNDGAQRLLLVLCLPLVDGVFATLLVAGAVQTFSDVLTIALTIFTGAGALAVLYSNSESRKEAQNMVKQVAPYLLIGAVLVSLIAPVFEQIFAIQQLKLAAGLALLVIAAEMAGFNASDKLAVPGIIITGMILSLQQTSALKLSLAYVVPASATALFAILALYLASYLNREMMSLSQIRLGGSLVLVVIALSLFGLEIPSELGLAIFATSVLISIDYRQLNRNNWKVLISI